MINRSLSIKNQAYAVLAMLESYESEFSELEGLRMDTFAWYNGRERGISIVASFSVFEPGLAIVFGEHRMSDAIFVDFYETKHGSTMDPPSHEDDGYEGAYEKRKCFDFGRADMAAAFIQGVIVKWAKDRPERVEATK